MQATTDHWIGEKYHQFSQQQKIVADALIHQYAFHETDYLLDVGCGDGKITHSLAQDCVPNGHAIGVDPSLSMITFAREKFRRNNLEFAINTAAGIEYENQFDVITSFSSLHWEPKQKEALQAFKRALKLGGHILLAIPGPDFVLRESIGHISSKPIYKNYFHAYRSPGKIWTVNEYAQLLIDTDFEINKIERVDRPYWMKDQNEYRGLLDAMLPQLSVLPESMREDFLTALIEEVIARGRQSADGHMLFEVKVIEVIAKKGN